MLWRSLAGKIDETAYQKILAGLEGNLADAQIFRYEMELVMDWKLGVLTEAKIDAVLAACRDLRGIVVPDPLTEQPTAVWPNDPASLKTVAEQLRRALRQPWVEAFWQVNSAGTGTKTLPE